MITLATSVHDPHQGLKWLSDKYLPELSSLFDSIVLVSSPFTPNEYLAELKQSGFDVYKRKDNRIGRTYFETVKRGMKTEPDYLLYCDFDRLLHWIHHHPGELKKLVKFLQAEIPKKNKIDYIIAERRPEDYKQHHEALYETEQLPNKIITQLMGEKNVHDYLSGCFVFSQKTGKYIVEHGGSEGYQFWGAWPVYLKKKKVKILYKRFQGLSWETPNQNREAVERAGGVQKWREALSSPVEWKRRTLMAREFVERIM